MYFWCLYTSVYILTVFSPKYPKSEVPMLGCWGFDNMHLQVSEMC